MVLKALNELLFHAVLHLLLLRLVEVEEVYCLINYFVIYVDYCFSNLTLGELDHLAPFLH